MDNRGPHLTYGHRQQDYRKIIRKVIHEREVRDAIATLQQRLNMLQLMRDDAASLIQRRKDRTVESKQSTYSEAILRHFLPIVVVLFCLLIVIFVGQWTLHQMKKLPKP